MSDSIDLIKTSFLKDLDNCQNYTDIQNLKIKYFGRKGQINSLLSKIKDLPVNQKRVEGAKINSFKIYLSEKCFLKENLLSKISKEEYLDITLPSKKRKKGSLHLTTYAIEEISQIFAALGFVRMSYPEVEWEYLAFEALNMPKGHPARDDFETFFIKQKEHPRYGRMILTPHTSSGQVREMQRVKLPPIKMINIGKCYRRNWDATHTPMFHQFEGLCIDKGINITHLKGTINYFVKQFFGSGREIRLRPFHFQFTEPSFEVDVTCDLCKAKGQINGEKCRVCKSGWLELGGAGMVHPNVLKAGKIDPFIYSGWAFGFGIERNFMMKEGLKLDDLRVMYENDIRFLEQF